MTHPTYKPRRPARNQWNCREKARVQQWAYPLFPIVMPKPNAMVIRAIVDRERGLQGAPQSEWTRVGKWTLSDGGDWSTDWKCME